MTNRMRLGLAGVAGAFSAFVVVAAIEAVGHAVHAPAMPPDLSSPEAAAAFVRALPLGAFLFVLAAYVIATVAGGIVAVLIARRHAMRLAAVVGGVILLASALNFIAIPHPAWFIAATVVAVPAAAWLTGRVGQTWAPA